MLLTCPNCETVFRIDSDRIGPQGQSVRCSVCAHVWQADPPMLMPEAEAGEMRNALGAVLTPFIILVLILGIGIGAVQERSTITAYAPGLIPVYDRLGMAVRPQIDKLQIIDLDADYAGDTLRLRGRLMNQAAVYVHAPALEVTVLSAGGEALVTEIIQPDDAIIRPAHATAFFAQLVMEEGREPTVTVTMRSDAVIRTAP
tara:strand:- start:3745 stop:4347 length:603 start_codon:yes stop_codon:yes gene_type:complete